METAAAGGRATPEHGNATGFNRWLFTFFGVWKLSGKRRLIKRYFVAVNRDGGWIAGFFADIILKCR